MIKQTVRRILPRKIIRSWEQWRDRERLSRAERAVAAFRRPSARSHGLPSQLIVSLTSYPQRYGTLAKTLKGLLAQTISPDRTILWIAKADMATLPDDVKDLRSCGLEIRPCHDLRSYNKIIHTLKLWPDAYAVTADDDLYYEPKWLETLVQGVRPGEKVIICRRAIRPKRIGDSFAAFVEWQQDIITNGELVDDLFPTGVGGVLYPPHSLSPEVMDEEVFTTLCPHDDDSWLYFMSRRAGSKYSQVGGGFAQTMWPGSQVTSLMSVNLIEGENDRQFRAVIEHYASSTPANEAKLT